MTQTRMNICECELTVKYQVLLMEQEMLNALNFRLTVATRLNFLQRFIEVAGQSHPLLPYLSEVHTLFFSCYLFVVSTHSFTLSFLSLDPLSNTFSLSSI
jgi:hypothetical protein